MQHTAIRSNRRHCKAIPWVAQRTSESPTIHTSVGHINKKKNNSPGNPGREMAEYNEVKRLNASDPCVL